MRTVTGSTLTGSVRIEYDPFTVAEQALIDELHAMTAGLAHGPVNRADPVASAPRLDVRRAPLLTLIGSSAVLVAACFPVSEPVLAALILASDIQGLSRAASALRRRQLDGDVLGASTLAVLVANGNYVASALLTWLRSVGEYIVAKSVVTTRTSLYELVADPDQRVLRFRGERRQEVRVAALQIGDVILLESGDQVPADGTVVAGEALVNQQTVTGEALPVERRSGDPVYAATGIEHGHLQVRVDRVGGDTVVGRIVRAIELAAEEKSEIQLFAERLADREVGRTLVLAALGAGLSRSLEAGTAILVADSGLAARVGIPTAIMTSIQRASGAGILVKGPRALENLARVNTVVFDKTGTLTSGTPQVTRVVSYRRSLEEHELVRLAAAAESGFRHPVARAVLRLAAEQRIRVPTSSGTTESIGLGVAVEVEGKRLLVGSHRFMDSRDIDLEAATADEAAAHAVGASPTFLAVDGRLAGMFVLEDELRAEARSAVLALRERRMRNVIMLSGDHVEPSRVIAESLGLRHYHADLLPGEKARLIGELKGEGRVVAMVGDGVNDALALEAADVGIAVPGGAPVATEVADVVLLQGGLDRVVRALDLAREGIDGVQRTLDIASRANLAVVVLASFGLVNPVTSILLSHGTMVGAAIAMAGYPGWQPAKAGPGRNKNVR
ncbi:MAG TPA: heavy metal translocating P-type ATPase [Gemmatimonadales bacterium]|nr:heavy metal translocating P-type ATPase [Gemmatimonadales bacterium]